MRILIVEDEPIAAKILLIMLERYDFIELILVAETLKEAKNFVISEKLDLVFLDLNLHGEDGFEILHLIKSIKKWINVCITSADKRLSTINKARNLGADEYIQKPFTKADIEGVIFGLGDK